MSIIRWLSKHLGWTNRTGNRLKSPARRPTVRLTLETLEARWLPSTLTVTSAADKGKGTLRAEIATAQNGDTIVFSPSLNSKTITLTKGELLINKNLTITGLGADQLTVNGNNKSRVFEIAAGAQVSMSGLKITQGKAAGANGGGVLVDTGAVLTLSDSDLIGNTVKFTRSAVGFGAAIYNDGTTTISDCTVSGNDILNTKGHSIGGGGVIYNHATLTLNDNSSVSENPIIGIENYGTTYLSKSTVSNNTFGGIYNDRVATLNACDSILSHNTSSRGAGLTNYGSATLTNCTVSDNSTTGIGYGGGIWSSGTGVLAIIGGTISNNSAYSGGGIEILLGSATISGNCKITGNSAKVEGGGIYLNASSLTISDSIVSGNSAGVGGGCSLSSGCSLNIDHSQVTGNTAEVGGGITTGGTVKVENGSSITGNLAPAGYSADDVYNVGVVQVDSTSTVGIVDRNPIVPL